MVGGGWGLTSIDSGSGGPKPVDTLIVYIYSKSDPEYEANLRFFVRNGVGAHDGCDYIIVVQQVGIVAKRSTIQSHHREDLECGVFPLPFPLPVWAAQASLRACAMPLC